MNRDIQTYNQSLEEAELCDLLANTIDEHLASDECKIWHAHPVWFIEGNPIVGYSKQKKGIRLMFWSGADFDESNLNIVGKKFKDASVFYQKATDVDAAELKRWLEKSERIQWDYKNIVKRKGKLERLK
ncbi:MAG: DUF1801 domain-containing protein [Chitinophagales bacterium]|nr:DUF1801 domain-containing protein [Chitinophagales bacterium]